MLIFKVGRTKGEMVCQVYIETSAPCIGRVGVSVVRDEIRIVKTASANQKLHVWQPMPSNPVSDSRATQKILLRYAGS